MAPWSMTWKAVLVCSAVAFEPFAARTLTMPLSLLAIGLPSWSTTVVLLFVAKVSVIVFSVAESKFELLTVIEIEPFTVAVAAVYLLSVPRSTHITVGVAGCEACAVVAVVEACEDAGVAGCEGCDGSVASAAAGTTSASATTRISLRIFNPPSELCSAVVAGRDRRHLLGTRARLEARAQGCEKSVRIPYGAAAH